MTDLHTHILPGMDDGAQSVEDALRMLHIQKQQGVDTVALTPHYYNNEETIDEFLARRKKAWIELSPVARGPECPNMILGAEVAWMPDMVSVPDLEKLCYQDTNILLVELPTAPWTNAVFQQLYALENRRGVMPMIAHIDRYLGLQRRDNIIKLLELGYPIQVSAETLFHMNVRRKALELLVEFDGLLI
jgi:protein-tyrosine phosphatase